MSENPYSHKYVETNGKNVLSALCASSGNSFWAEDQKSQVEECVIMLQFMITSPIKASSSCIDSASLSAGLNLNGLWIHSSWIASLDKLCVNCWHRPRPRCSATKDWIGTTVGPTSCMKSASVGNMSKHPFSTRVAFPFSLTRSSTIFYWPWKVWSLPWKNSGGFPATSTCLDSRCRQSFVCLMLSLAKISWQTTHKGRGSSAGPVHVNPKLK